MRASFSSSPFLSFTQKFANVPSMEGLNLNLPPLLVLVIDPFFAGGSASPAISHQGNEEDDDRHADGGTRGDRHHFGRKATNSDEQHLLGRHTLCCLQIACGSATTLRCLQIACGSLSGGQDQWSLEKGKCITTYELKLPSHCSSIDFSGSHPGEGCANKQCGSRPCDRPKGTQDTFGPLRERLQT